MLLNLYTITKQFTSSVQLVSRRRRRRRRPTERCSPGIVHVCRLCCPETSHRNEHLRMYSSVVSEMCPAQHIAYSVTYGGVKSERAEAICMCSCCKLLDAFRTTRTQPPGHPLKCNQPMRNPFMHYLVVYSITRISDESVHQFHVHCASFRPAADGTFTR